MNIKETDKKNFRDLVIKSQAGDREAFSELYREWFSRILRFFYSRIGNAQAAEDLCQLVFLKIWKNVRGVKESEASLAWIFSIARNTLIDFWRKKKEVLVGDWSDLEGFYQSEDVEHLADLKAKSQSVFHSLSRLNEEQREAIVMKFFDGLSNKEIESITGKSQMAIRSLQYRAIVSLKKIIKEDDLGK